MNWMTAGRGIVHSERTPPDLATVAYRTHGLQLWAALPRSHEEAAPAFSHTPASALPSLAVGQAGVRVLMGRAWNAESPVPVLMETLYVDIELPPGGTLQIPPLAPERALYPVLGAIEVEGRSFSPREMAVLDGGDSVTIRAAQPSRLVLIGAGLLPTGVRRVAAGDLRSRGDGRVAELCLSFRGSMKGDRADHAAVLTADRRDARHEEATDR